jgi:serine protease
MGRYGRASAIGFAVALGLGARTWARQDPAQHVVMTGGELAALDDALSRRLPYIPTQVVVKFRSGVTDDGRNRALAAIRSRPTSDELVWKGPVAIATDLGQPDAAVLASQLRAQPEVEYAEPNYLYYGDSVPNDPGYAAHQWNLQALDMPRVWDINPGGSAAITVAVVDTGVTTINTPLVFRTWNGFGFTNTGVPFGVNPDLPASRFVAPFDFALTGTATVLDLGGHGTHVSSTIGEEANNSTAEAGIAYRVKIMPVKVLACYWDRQFVRSANGITGFELPFQNTCAGSNATIAQGIRYAADNGAKVINLSLGGPSSSLTAQDAVTYAVSRGAFVAIAAGNDYEDGSPTSYPAAYAKGLDGAMAVGAVGRSLRHAHYSTVGSYVEIAAPGGDISADGSSGGVWQTTLFSPDFDPAAVLFPRFDRYLDVSYEGTSMATPHVAGTAALLFTQLGSSVSPAVVEQLIAATARPCDQSSCDPSVVVAGATGRNDTFGAGLVQPRAALFGFGIRR